MRFIPRQLACVLLLAPCVLTGCGGGDGGTSGDGGSPAVQTNTAHPPATGGNTSAPTANNVAGFAFVANFNPNDISAYTIDATTGALTALGAPVAAGTSPSSIAVDPTAKFAYVANIGSMTSRLSRSMPEPAP